MATRAGEGISSSLGFSLRLQELILGIFAVTIGTVILPDMSGLAAQEKWEDFNKMLLQAIKIMIVISIPVTAYSLITGREIITLVYKNNMFDEKSVALTLGEFRFHIAGLVFIALNRIIGPAFYAQKNSKLPTLAGIICFGSNILLVLILVKPFGGNGIACALSIASLINTIFLFIFMKKLGTIQPAQL
jgi:putative peptidoglycan lipid II flippase